MPKITATEPRELSMKKRMRPFGHGGTPYYDEARAMLRFIECLANVWKDRPESNRLDGDGVMPRSDPHRRCSANSRFA